MPDRRRHRSAAPADRELFSGAALETLRAAAEHYAWLLDRGYAEDSSMKLVGDRFELRRRQRDALRRAVCRAAECAARETRRAGAGDLAGARVAVDGFNVLTTVESALGGGLVLLARDGCARDLASLHGTWRRVAETPRAIEAVGEHLERGGARAVEWYLDAPVSNSGRLAALLRAAARERRWPWDVHVVADPDRDLVQDPAALVASADRGVLDRSTAWTNLARELVEARVPGAWLVELAPGLPGRAPMA